MNFFSKKHLHFKRQHAIITKLSVRYAPLAQLDRASGYGPEGRGFESLTAYQKLLKSKISGAFCFASGNLPGFSHVLLRRGGQSWSLESRKIRFWGLSRLLLRKFFLERVRRLHTPGGWLAFLDVSLKNVCVK